MATLAPQGAQATNFNPAAVSGQVGSLDPTLTPPPASQAAPIPADPNSGRTPVTLGNGSTVYYDKAGTAYDKSGTLVPDSVISTSTIANPAAPPTTSGTPVPVNASAPTAADTFHTSLASTLAAQQQQLDASYKQQQANYQQQIDALNQQQTQTKQMQELGLASEDSTVAKESADKQAALDQEKQQFQDNFDARQKLVGTLQTLLTTGQNAIDSIKNTSGMSSIMNARVSETLASVQGQAGVISASLAAYDSQIGLAQSQLQSAIAAITSIYSDQISYWTNVVNFYTNQAQDNEAQIASLTQEQKGYIDAQIKVQQDSVANTQANLKTLQDAMTNPTTALAYAKAGVSLTDSPDQINQKLAAYAETQHDKTQVISLPNSGSALIDSATGAVIRSYGSAAVGTVPTTVVRTVQTSSGTTTISGYTLKAGDDPYNIAQLYGTDMATLQRLNPGITDWHTLQVGAVINLPNTTDTWLNGKTTDQIQAFNGLPDSEKAAVKQLVTGDALLTDIVKSRGSQTQDQINKLVTEATAIDPTFSINANKQRYAYQTQFNNPNGKEQLQIVAINTALGHLAEFKTASDALGNAALLPYNQLVNYLKTNSGDPAVAKVNTVITALAGELASVYKGGTAPTDQETEQWRNSILASFSQSQVSGVTATTADLISNKMLSLGNSYKNVMGSYPDSPIVNSSQLQQLIDSGVDTSGITGALRQQGYNPPTTTSSAAVDSTLGQYGLGASADSILSKYGL